MAAASFSLPFHVRIPRPIFLPQPFYWVIFTKQVPWFNTKQRRRRGKRRCCSRDGYFNFSAFSIWKYLDEKNDGFAVLRDPFRGRKEVSTRYLRQAVFLVGCVTFLFSVHSIYFHCERETSVSLALIQLLDATNALPPVFCDFHGLPTVPAALFIYPRICRA